MIFKIENALKNLNTLNKLCSQPFENVTCQTTTFTWQTIWFDCFFFPLSEIKRLIIKPRNSTDFYRNHVIVFSIILEAFLFQKNVNGAEPHKKQNSH